MSEQENRAARTGGQATVTAKGRKGARGRARVQADAGTIRQDKDNKKGEGRNVDSARQVA